MVDHDKHCGTSWWTSGGAFPLEPVIGPKFGRLTATSLLIVSINDWLWRRWT